MKKELDIQQKISLITKIEKSINTHSLQCEGICIWPIVQNILICNITQGNKTSTNHSDMLIGLSAGKLNIKRKIASIMWNILSRFRLRKKVDDLLILRDNELKVGSGNEMFYPHLKNWNKLNKNRTRATLEINSSEFQFLRKSSSIRQRDISFTGLEPFIQICKELEVSIDHKWIHDNVREVFAIKEAFEKYFSRVSKPKCIYFACYFDLYSFGASLAASSLNINSIEIQHGQQGRYNPFYHFLGIDIGKFALLPDFIWIWGKETQKKFIDKLRAPISGNLYLPGSQRNQAASSDILYALQPCDDPVPAFLLEVIKKSDKTWYFRLHPRMLKDIEWYKEEYSSFPNIEFILANSLELFSLIDKVETVVTKWSTVIYEGVYLGRRGIVISQYGRELMHEDIERGNLFFADDVEQFFHCLSQENIKDLSHFFCDDKKMIEEEIKRSQSAS